ncbi:hypothetical protein PVK06_003241 [Gossypium arboreum]|uniref:Uncharacterized protein n=1 Tax=Gossypium arboreum TaxID=29729 RepID=A0ABR0R5S2_GOSAR|nr:hypothetical protein PVK06_003241 [Gossypium arboreum]
MASIASKELAANNPGLHTSPYETNKGYLVLQTMFQIKDPKISLDFYPLIGILKVTRSSKDTKPGIQNLRLWKQQWHMLQISFAISVSVWRYVFLYIISSVSGTH